MGEPIRRVVQRPAARRVPGRRAVRQPARGAGADRGLADRVQHEAPAYGPPPADLRWRTVRDALTGLPEPVDFQEHALFANHAGKPGARSYVGHTGSPMDEPAKTLKAGVHGVPGGENMLRRADGSVRYFTPREAARLQTFPDEYCFSGPWSEIVRQLGNAVPVWMAERMARSIRGLLEGAATKGRGGREDDRRREPWRLGEGAASGRCWRRQGTGEPQKDATGAPRTTGAIGAGRSCPGRPRGIVAGRTGARAGRTRGLDPAGPCSLAWSDRAGAIKNDPPRVPGQDAKSAALAG